MIQNAQHELFKGSVDSLIVRRTSFTLKTIITFKITADLSYYFLRHLILLVR